MYNYYIQLLYTITIYNYYIHTQLLYTYSNKAGVHQPYCSTGHQPGIPAGRREYKGTLGSIPIAMAALALLFWCPSWSGCCD